MRRLSFGILLIALATLVLELMLTRVFDVLLTPNIAYFVVTLAVFGFGLAGIRATLRPIPVDREIGEILFTRSAAFAATTALLIPLINVLPLDYTRLGREPFLILAAFALLYVALLLPFFLAGYVLIAAFSKHALRIQRLYFWDLVGAGLGSVIVVPFISTLGPGGLMVGAAALGLLAASMFTESKVRRRAAVVLALAVAALPLVKAPDYIDFVPHMNKQGNLRDAEAKGRRELVRWDPISKITVTDETWSPEIATPWHLYGDRKSVQYDGGNQTSYFYKFDGDLGALRERLDRDKSRLTEHFWQIGVLASHYLKRDSGQSVLVIGSAGGQETKAAVMYGAAHVDAIELVPTVVELATGAYSRYIGDIFHNPAVHVQAGEGRSFLRHSHRTYDIIQIYSNHTSSSVAQGTGALAPVYLQTAEAYQEYFSHLTANGILHINHYAYPRMLTTAALAWKRMGRTDFARHVAVYAYALEPLLPTLLIKNQPWTAAEIASLNRFLAPPEADPAHRLGLVENPLDPAERFLSQDFYSGEFPDELADRMAVNVTPRTDERPYFALMRKTIAVLEPDAKNYLDAGTAAFLNRSLVRGVIPMDLVHLLLTGFVSIVFVLLFVLVPLRFSKIGREKGATAIPLLVYFSCLGAGFIILELVFIQKFMQLIGSPLHTYSTVIFTLLLAAGIGSGSSERLGIESRRRWAVPFVGVLAVGLAFVALYPWLSSLVLALPLGGRMLASAAMIFPIGFLLGMPFPLGILAIAHQPRGAIAWAWGMNGLFTVVGGLLSVPISIAFGFNVAILAALGLYAVAFAAFRRLRDPVDDVAGEAAPGDLLRGPSGSFSSIERRPSP
jgi:spermidine synthase